MKIIQEETKDIIGHGGKDFLGILAIGLIFIISGTFLYYKPLLPFQQKTTEHVEHIRATGDSVTLTFEGKPNPMQLSKALKMYRKEKRTYFTKKDFRYMYPVDQPFAMALVIIGLALMVVVFPILESIRKAVERSKRNPLEDKDEARID